LKEKIRQQAEALVNQPQNLKSSNTPSGVIPVVFHIIPAPCGINFTFSKPELEVILDRVNSNFRGEHPNYNPGDPFYSDKADPMQIEFRLAEIE